MKKNLTIVFAGVIISFLSLSGARAQEFKKVNPKMNHVLADTTFVRGTEVTIEPGEKSDLHTHPAHFFYALTDGKLMVHYSDGVNEPYDLKQGDAGISGPERPHTVENAGKTTIKFLLVELKEHPYKAGKTMKK